MISMHNFRLYEDLKEELEENKIKLKTLKVLKIPKIEEVALDLLRRIQLYFENHDFEVNEKDTNFDYNFFVRYKNGSFNGRLLKNDNLVSVYCNQDLIRNIKVIPYPRKVIRVGRINPYDDMLKDKINNIYEEIEMISGEIESYQRDRFCYCLSEDTKIVFENKDKVLDDLFL